MRIITADTIRSRRKHLLVLAAVAVLGFGGLVAMPSPADAALVPCGTRANPEPCTLCHLIVGMNGIITWVRNVMVFVGLAVLVAMGIWYIVSAGDEGMMSQAKSGIKAVIAGLLVVLLAWVVINTLMFVVFGSYSDLGVQATFSGTSGFTFTCSTTSSTLTP